MPEDMSDRMPEDLPVRKCINSIVGIIRSEVFFLTHRDRHELFHVFQVPVSTNQRDQSWNG